MSLYQNKEKDSLRWYKSQKKEKSHLKDKLDKAIEKYDSLYNHETIQDLKVEIQKYQANLETMKTKAKIQQDVITEQTEKLQQKDKMIGQL